MTERLALGELVREAEERRERSRAVNAVYQSGSIVVLGATLYGACWLYSALSNATQELHEAVEGVTVGAEVAPEVFTNEGFQVLDQYYAGRGWGAQGRFRSDYRRASMMYERDGRVKALPWALDKIDKWEGILASHGVIEQRVSAVHPVDKGAGIILNNKWYWGIVMGLAALPAVGVIKDVIENVEV